MVSNKRSCQKRNTHVKYENLNTYQSKVMTKVKVFEKKVKLQGQKSEEGSTLTLVHLSGTFIDKIFGHVNIAGYVRFTMTSGVF
jgi:hypothetical protein